jgi:HAD superfamily hydrolase (TIGR01509 family)
MNHTQAVIFDLGGVLLNLAPERTKHAFEELGIGDFDRLFTVFKATPLFDQLETGHVSPEEFIATLRKELPSGVQDASIVDAWNAMLLDFRTESLRFVESLKATRPTFLYSNTNRIHYEAFQQTLRETTSYPSLDHLFHKAYYSHEMGHRKPDPGGYLHIIRNEGLDPSTTLFVDDNLKNIEGARDTGLQTHHLKPGESVEQVLASLR